MTLTLTEAAKDLIAGAGYDPAFGARPLRRAIRDMVENPLAKKLLAGEFSEGDAVVADAADGEILFRKD